MTKYLTGRIHIDTIRDHSTEKAFYVTIDDGRTLSDGNGHMWLPKSRCEISEPNDIGWCDILVPVWLFTNNRIDYHRVMEISWVAPGIVIK